MFLRDLLYFLLDFFIAPIRLVPTLLGLGYVAFLALNAAIILIVPVLWDLYVADAPRFMGAFREWSFFDGTAFLGYPAVFATLAFFNLVLANNLTNIVFARSRWGWVYPAQYAPVSLKDYRLAGWAMSYYAVCFGADFLFFEMGLEGLAHQIASISGQVASL
ncbi:hypothetical protein E1162_08810 [Rhodobacteraceae bacterium RKSG542]|uniref:hypothetical protein n=1 Tax=Pseudovibrio flavus TaxID=2529854 RepID=UPI0012BCC47A|nr:hypothetical protein [Pseudovibrio flavus]MTI17341.1 hypothetical protein [Pseudovibrio flavus]